MSSFAVHKGHVMCLALASRDGALVSGGYNRMVWCHDVLECAKDL